MLGFYLFVWLYCFFVCIIFCMVSFSKIKLPKQTWCRLRLLFSSPTRRFCQVATVSPVGLSSSFFWKFGLPSVCSHEETSTLSRCIDRSCNHLYSILCLCHGGKFFNQMVSDNNKYPCGTDRMGCACIALV
jgi:hypothetical protein